MEDFDGTIFPAFYLTPPIFLPVTGNTSCGDGYGEIFGFKFRISRLGDQLSFFWRDVTERVQAERTLRESEEMLRLALTAGQAGGGAGI